MKTPSRKTLIFLLLGTLAVLLLVWLVRQWVQLLPMQWLTTTMGIHKLRPMMLN